MNSNNLMRWFKETDARTIQEQDIVTHVEELATWVDDALEEGPEKTVGLRKLLEARDCFFRAAQES